MKGIVLAGGTGSRLWPLTFSTSKQLLPVYDKPMIYYPISTLMLAGIRDILIITTPEDYASFKNILGDGTRFGVNFQYIQQDKPEGIAQAYLLGESFLDGDASLMILGDNIFHGVGLGTNLETILKPVAARIFCYEVENPSEYGVAEFGDSGKLLAVTEKPVNPKPRFAVTGLYYFDERAPYFAKSIVPSARGELEITSLINNYASVGEIEVVRLARGAAWLDTGTPKTLHDAATYVRIIEERTGHKIACLEEIALNRKWITPGQISKSLNFSRQNSYQMYLKVLVEQYESR